jgi:hypothetical protein
MELASQAMHQAKKYGRNKAVESSSLKVQPHEKPST